MFSNLKHFLLTSGSAQPSASQPSVPSESLVCLHMLPRDSNTFRLCLVPRVRLYVVQTAQTNNRWLGRVKTSVNLPHNSKVGGRGPRLTLLVTPWHNVAVVLFDSDPRPVSRVSAQPHPLQLCFLKISLLSSSAELPRRKLIESLSGFPGVCVFRTCRLDEWPRICHETDRGQGERAPTL